MKTRLCTAYTLIELLLAVSLIIIVLGITVPSWQLLLQNNSAATQGNKIVAALEYTRILAMKQSKNIAFCRKDFLDGSNNKDWSSGQVVVDQNEIKTNGGKILRFFSAVPQNDRLWWISDFGKNDCIIFNQIGVPEGQQGSFYYCHNTKTGAESGRQSWEIIVQETGNIYVHFLDKCPQQ